ncbi:hypothetical protein [Rhodococcus sp. IEGM 1379]|uniref:hypothetical protein n=1 Tax=Rhodococcus sp. IEGM 1379 TaxID=3047086 RepID=UPI0024B83E70|nr:hypothetical protein [Rhodococcus sp. IEGM 1379]MDI9914449.1 hypothetical protein [Rhodococcus sp. IEGM 1379]
MTEVSSRVADALGPVRAELLANARRDADRLVKQARSDAAATLALAQMQADDSRAEARARGEADAEEILGAERGRARREARSIVLNAQREVEEDLRTRVRAAVVALIDDIDYPNMRAVLDRRARELLGPDATVLEHFSGGVVAQTRGHRAVLSLEALADYAVERLDARIAGLWEP